MQYRNDKKVYIWWAELEPIEMLNEKGKDKGCVRRVAGSEKREWQKAGWLVSWLIRKH